MRSAHFINALSQPCTCGRSSGAGCSGASLLVSEDDVSHIPENLLEAVLLSGQKGGYESPVVFGPMIGDYGRCSHLDQKGEHEDS